ncbi:M23 family metallopeptidase [Gordonia hongkongensis]|uniref:M23 family metallopeptidase n=1 Tax=Gordonia hongkongensis TaxID=1701090 RepID=A0AAX3TAL1_9ACTN|nr:M23 family metallopeptidase [Gordonia hongkongensis]QIK49006.1 M23 family metallopeptidase [Gordonia terrae]WFP26084.1 M23 family metallopeptidase [Gordonia hongkongensis]
MDDLAGLGVSRGSGRVRSGGLIDDVTAEEMTTIIPIVDTDDAAGYDLTDFEFDFADSDTSTREHSDAGWTPSSWQGYYRPTRSEITQDILIPEHEFDQYEHDEPFDVEGAELDSFDGGELHSLDDDDLDDDTEHRPFRTNPAGQRVRRGGKHRIAAPPNALKGGRAALIAMAAGAAVAAVAQVGTNDEAPAPVNAAAVNDATAPGAAPVELGPGVAAATAHTDQMNVFTNQLGVGAKMAADQDRREALARRPLFTSPIPLGSYDFTSAFAMRWGTMHGGIDMAAPLGTPIHAATDGVVIKAEPASGYGHWVQIQAADGTVTMYGHMASSGVLVTEGQRVTAGDVIALVGNEGFSFGPHLHFEVWKNGNTKIDPVPWLAAKGVKLSGYTG